MRINPEKNFLFGEKVSNMGQYAKNDNNYRLHLGGKRVFHWFKEKWQSLKQTVKNSFRIR